MTAVTGGDSSSFPWQDIRPGYGVFLPQKIRGILRMFLDEELVIFYNYSDCFQSIVCFLPFFS
ncbi:MAG: hypothetical protein D6681_01790 [Calditrichaeota bacterium]|nr:MAG: hypothetical protein D6681_01790 [Calditrichota bacterium]